MPFLATAWRWFTNNPIAQIVTAFVLALIGWEVVKRNIQETGRIKERERIAAAMAKEHARTVETVTQLGQETSDAKDRALAAPDAVSDVRSADELRDRYPDNASVILRPRPASGGQGS